MSQADLSFQHLQLEFARLDILFQRQVTRFQTGNTPPPNSDPTAFLRSLHISDTQVSALLQRPFGYQHGLLNEEMERPLQDALQEIETKISHFIDDAEENAVPVRLHILSALLDLSRFEIDTLLLTIAPQLDGKYGQLCGYLQDDLTQKRPSIDLILDILTPIGPERLQLLPYFRDDAPLFRHRLIKRRQPHNGEHPLLINQTLEPDNSIVNWLLLGQYQPSALLQPYVSYESNVDVDITILPPTMQQAMMNAASSTAIQVFYGPDEVAQKTAASLLAAATAQPLLSLDLAKAVSNEMDALEITRLLLRDSLLNLAIPQITAWDKCLVDDAPLPDLLTAVCDYPGLLIIASEKRWQPRDIIRQRRLYWHRFPLPNTEQRHHLLQHFVSAVNSEADSEANSEAASEATSQLDLDSLAGQFTLNTGQLRDLVNTAYDLAAQEGTPLANKHLFAAARAHSNPKLETLARKLKPRYGWADLILPEESAEILHEMVDTIRSRPVVLEEWGVGKKLTSSAGITALFFGPPGTGKTLGAEIIAGELGLDLYKIDLSSMVSKYIGETEKNLERIFTEAESSNAILFFDEADAIFGKRSEVKDAHDRYANIEVSYLLQRMEMYNGVTILATNLRANLDEAFMRRIQFALDFPFPKAVDRERIWQTLFPPDVPRADEIDWQWLAERFEIAGGNIRNIIVTAAYLAASNGQIVTMDHLLHGTRRELQKMGRLVNERDLQRDG